MEIKKGVPIPKSRFGAGGAGRPSRYPFAQMEVGDCFDVLVGDEKPDTVMRRLRGSSGSWRKRTSAACGFSARVVTENGALAVRVWKTAPRVKAQ